MLPSKSPLPMVLTVPNRDDWFEEDHGFPHPNWGAVEGWMRVYASDEQMDDAYRQIVRHWMNRLRERLGGEYRVVESDNFVLFTELNGRKCSDMLSFLERTRAHIYRVVGNVREPKLYGKHVVLRFSKDGDYYAYLSHFRPDGEYAQSSGILLTGGYNHIALPKSWSEAEESQVLVHELTHDLLFHLPHPRWLSEALAMAFETEVGGQAEALTRELARRHREYWNEKTIQDFWSGVSYSDVEGQELSYGLARILLNLIYTELRPSPENFHKFVLRADWTDAGAIAIREHLDEELENLVASFLGPGDWSPKRKEWKFSQRQPEPAGEDEDVEFQNEED